jgi:hypothetical protein
MTTPSEISSPVAATADWPWSTSPRDPAATVLEWYLHADLHTLRTRSAWR